MEENERRIINSLLYLRKNIDGMIDNIITEDVLRGKPIDIERLKESIIYHIDEDLGRFVEA